MVIKSTGVRSPDGANYVTLTDGSGNIVAPADNTNITMVQGQPLASPELGGRLAVNDPDDFLPAGIAGFTLTGTGIVFTLTNSGYQSVLIHQILNAGNNTWALQGSNDGQTWNTIAGQFADAYSTTATTNSATGSNRALIFPLLYHWIRMNVTAGTGLLNVVPVFRKSPFVPMVSGTSSALASASGGASFLRIAAGQATTTVKSGAGTFYALIFSGAATATSTCTIYDNTAASGTIIAVPVATGITFPTTIDFGPVGLAFGTGLTVITATANGADMTFVYK